MDIAGSPATVQRLVTICALSLFVARAGEMAALSFHFFAPSTYAVTYVTGREKTSKSSVNFAVENTSETLRPVPSKV